MTDVIIANLCLRRINHCINRYLTPAYKTLQTRPLSTLDGTGSALRDPATEFRTREIEFVADDPEQWGVGRNVHFTFLPVDRKGNQGRSPSAVLNMVAIVAGCGLFRRAVGAGGLIPFGLYGRRSLGETPSRLSYYLRSAKPTPVRCGTRPKTALRIAPQLRLRFPYDVFGLAQLQWIILCCSWGRNACTTAHASTRSMKGAILDSGGPSDYSIRRNDYGASPHSEPGSRSVRGVPATPDPKPNSPSILCTSRSQSWVKLGQILSRRSVGQRAVEIDREMRAVAERLVSRVATPAKGDLRGLVDLATVVVGDLYRTGDHVRAVLRGSDANIRH
jgi:hypothetical protein